jgi:hypothetical protein
MYKLWTYSTLWTSICRFASRIPSLRLRCWLWWGHIDLSSFHLVCCRWFLDFITLFMEIVKLWFISHCEHVMVFLKTFDLMCGKCGDICQIWLMACVWCMWCFWTSRRGLVFSGGALWEQTWAVAPQPTNKIAITCKYLAHLSSEI